MRILLAEDEKRMASALEVTNDGEEIPREKMAHLFDRFYRVDEARGDEDRHYGLAIAKAVAEKHGGSIHVACPEGKVQFTVSVPAKKFKKLQSSFNLSPLQ